MPLGAPKKGKNRKPTELCFASFLAFIMGFILKPGFFVQIFVRSTYGASQEGDFSFQFQKKIELIIAVI